MNKKYFLSLLPYVLSATLACASDSSHTQQSKQVTQQIFHPDAATICRKVFTDSDVRDEKWFTVIASMAGKKVDNTTLLDIVSKGTAMVWYTFCCSRWQEEEQMKNIRDFLKDIIVTQNLPSISPQPKRKSEDAVSVRRSERIAALQKKHKEMHLLSGQ